MSEPNVRRSPVVPIAVLLLLGVAAVIVWPLFAQSRNESDKTAKESRYTVPEAASPEELLRFVQQTAQHIGDLEGKDHKDERIKGLNAILDAGEQMLSHEDAVDNDRRNGMRIKVITLVNLSNEGVEDARPKLKAFLEKLTKDKNENIAEMATAQLLQLRVEKVDELNNKERDRLKDDVLDYAAGKPGKRLPTALEFGNALEKHSRNEMAARVFEGLAKLAENSDDEELKPLIPRLKGYARRATLVGRPLEITGKTVDGDEFDWSKFQGKVVLVDFWATWCGPCRAALPGLQKVHKEFHDEGFEVVGISLDENKAALKDFIEQAEIEWPNLVDSKSEKSMATRYGVVGIPMTILVGRDGKVVAMNPHGPQISRMLPDLLKQKPAKPAKSDDAKSGKGESSNAKSSDAKSGDGEQSP